MNETNETKPSRAETEMETVRAAAALAGLSRREMLQRAGFSAITLLLVAGTEMGTPKKSLAAVPRPVFFAEEAGDTAPAPATDPARQQLPYYTDGPWDKPEYYQTIQAGHRNFPKTFQSADIDGDSRDEMIARGPGGIHVSKYNPETGQWGSMAEPRALDNGGLWRDSYGWDQPQYYSTIQLADIDGDRKAELIGRGGQGIEIFRYDASATVPKWVKMLPPAGVIFTDASGWNKPQYYSTIQCADIDGDGKAELIGRGGQGMEAYQYDPSRDPALGWYALPRLTAWSDVPGNGLWTRPEHYTTIQCADIDGDGKAELIGRGGGGIEVYRFAGDAGWQAMPPLPAMSAGWDAPQNYTTIQCGDVDGDGKAELIGRSSAGIEVYKYDAAAGWQPMPFPQGETGGGLWSDAAGWNQPQYYTTIQLADIDGDGQDELVGRGGQGLEAYQYDSATHSWSKMPGLLAGWRDDFRWNQVQYYATIQSARVLKQGDFGYIGDGRHTQAALLGRGKLGVQTHSYSGTRVGWEQAPAGFGAFTPGQQSAFEKLDAVLRPSLPPDRRGSAGNIRASYNDTTFFASGQFREWQNRMFSSRPDHGYTGVRPPLNPSFAPAPAGIDPNDWAAVCWQVYWELEWVQDVYVWYGPEQFGGLIDKAAIKKLQILPKIASHLTEKEESSVTTELVVKIIEIFTKGVELFLTEGASLILEVDEDIAGNLGFAASVAGQIISSLTAYSEPNNGKAFTIAYNKLQGELDTAFDAAVAGNETNKFRLTGGWIGTYVPADLGRLRQISEWMKDGTWSWNTGPDGGTTSILLANLSRGFAIYVWQALYAAAKPWYVFHYQKNNGANIPENFPAKYVWFNNWLGRPRLFLSTVVPSEETLSDWFDPVVSSQTFPLGVPFSDVYLGQHGWIFSQRFDGTETPYAPSFGVDMRTTAALSRDADTGEVLALVTLDNQGMTAATNVEITSATLGSQSAIANHSLQQIQVHTGNEQKAVMTFPNLRSGTKTVLRISGSYLGGTFGTSLRLTVP